MMPNADWASSNVPVKSKRNPKGFFLALLICLAYGHAYSQSCNCPPVNLCGMCTGGFVDLTFRYNGGLAVSVSARDLSGGLFLDLLVSNGETFSVQGSLPNGLFLGNQLQLRINGILNYTFDTSCGQPVAVNSNYGSFTLLAAESFSGGRLCCPGPVLDTTAPVISNCPSNIQVSLGSSSCTTPVNWTIPTAVDNCGDVTLTSTRNPGDSFGKGTSLVTYTATDDYGNTSTCSFNVTVVDDVDPVITGCSSNIVVSANASCQATATWTPPTASDNCTGVTLTTTKNPGSTFSLGTTPVTYTATDASGNTSTCSFNVIVQDNTNPVITGCPSNIVATANASCKATVTWTPPTASDNCSTVMLTSTKSPGSVFSVGTTVVTYTATDAKGNVSKCSFNVTVQDNTYPVITGCPANIVVNANASCQATATWTPPTASDNCSGVTLTTTKNPASMFPIGTTSVTYTATDASGKTATCSFTVTVLDNTNPVITGCPTGVVIGADAFCQAIVSWIEPTASDNCGSITINSTKKPGSSFTVGTTPVTYTATDAAGNTSTCSFNVVVKDERAPEFASFSDVKAEAGEACSARVSWTEPTTADCSEATMVSTHHPNDVFPMGTTEVSYTATDSQGRSSTLKFNVIVEDKTAPVFSFCPQNIVQEIDGPCSTPMSWSVPTASDNCTPVTVVASHNPGDIFPIGSTVVRYSATDAHGNVAVCEFSITVKNKSLPVFTNCPQDIAVKSNEHGEAIVDWLPPDATDGCGTVVVTASRKPGSVFSIGSTVVEYVGENAFGNKSYCRFNVSVTQQEIDISIGKFVTPDGNGENDAWIVMNIEKFQDNKVVIVDRWGSVIYTASGYNNNNIVWRGQNQAGGMVPVGTYFYTISVRYGKSSLEKSGFIELIH